VYLRTTAVKPTQLQSNKHVTRRPNVQNAVNARHARVYTTTSFPQLLPLLHWSRSRYTWSQMTSARKTCCRCDNQLSGAAEVTCITNWKLICYTMGSVPRGFLRCLRNLPPRRTRQRWITDDIVRFRRESLRKYGLNILFWHQGTFCHQQSESFTRSIQLPTFRVDS